MSRGLKDENEPAIWRVKGKANTKDPGDWKGLGCSRNRREDSVIEVQRARGQWVIRDVSWKKGTGKGKAS